MLHFSMFHELGGSYFQCMAYTSKVNENAVWKGKDWLSPKKQSVSITFAQWHHIDSPAGLGRLVWYPKKQGKTDEAFRIKKDRYEKGIDFGSIPPSNSGKWGFIRDPQALKNVM